MTRLIPGFILSRKYTQRISSFLLCLLLLPALIPEGYMPVYSAEHGLVMMICDGHGPVQLKPEHHNGHSSHHSAHHSSYNDHHSGHHSSMQSHSGLCLFSGLTAFSISTPAMLRTASLRPLRQQPLSALQNQRRTVRFSRPGARAPPVFL